MMPSVGVVAHLHGGKVPHGADGWPLAPVGYAGNPYGFSTVQTYPPYPNDQRAAMLWFHDHAMDNTAPQVHAGLAGLYFIRDDSDDAIFGLIGGNSQEIPLVFQDRVFDCGYEAMDYGAGIPRNDAYNRPEFLGDTIVVNGRATPFHSVNRAIYRLRILNGSNTRTYALALLDPYSWVKGTAGARIWYSDCLRVIGTDAGLLAHSVPLERTDYLLLAPAERVDVLLDLTAIPGVNYLRLVNLAVASAQRDEGPEGIFQSDALSVLSTARPDGSVLPGPTDENDSRLLQALALGPANIMQFCICPLAPSAGALDVAALDRVLGDHASEDGFRWENGVLTAEPGSAVARNRFILLMNNTGHDTPHPLTTEWKDTQMWELGSPDGIAPTWNMPFAIDTTSANPAAGNPADQTLYRVYRVTFFQDDPPPPINPSTGYPTIHQPTFMPKSGTYERWYSITK